MHKMRWPLYLIAFTSITGAVHADPLTEAQATDLAKAKCAEELKKYPSLKDLQWAAEKLGDGRWFFRAMPKGSSSAGVVTVVPGDSFPCHYFLRSD